MNFLSKGNMRVSVDDNDSSRAQRFALTVVKSSKGVNMKKHIDRFLAGFQTDMIQVCGAGVGLTMVGVCIAAIVVLSPWWVTLIIIIIAVLGLIYMAGWEAEEGMLKPSDEGDE